MHSRYLPLSLFCAAVVLAGCVTTIQSISAVERKALTSVTLSPEVVKPEAMSYLGPGGAFGLMFGAIGGALAAPSMEANRSSFQQFLDKHGISIEKIVYEEMEAAMRHSGKFPLSASPQPGGATTALVIKAYGFSIPTGFHSTLAPTLTVQAEMKNAAGAVIWAAGEHLGPLGNPVPLVEPDALRSDPKVLEGSWRAAARHVAAGIVAAY